MARQILRIGSELGVNPWLDELADVYIKNFSSPPWGDELEKNEVKDLIREVCDLQAGVGFVSLLNDQVEAFLIAYPAKHHAEIEKKYSHAKTGIAMFFELAISDWQDIEGVVNALVSELKKYAEKQMFSFLICQEIMGTKTSFIFSADLFSTFQKSASAPLMMEKRLEWTRK